MLSLRRNDRAISNRCFPSKTAIVRWQGSSNCPVVTARTALMGSSTPSGCFSVSGTCSFDGLLGGTSFRSATCPLLNFMSTEPDLELLLYLNEYSEGLGAPRVKSPVLCVVPDHFRTPKRAETLALPASE